MKTNRIRVAIAALASALVLTTTLAQPLAAADVASAMPIASDTTVVAVSQLTPQEAADLAFMREEEKLARDVYQTLYETWGLSIFQNIARSEQTHMDAVKTLLTRYGLADPAAGRATGEFSDPALQALYNDLVAQGSQSLADALRVGGAIEEIDILDLWERLTHTDKADIKLVFDNLTKGSYNHLRSFASTLKQQTGETYEPQYLTPDQYNSILGSASGGRGRGWR